MRYTFGTDILNTSGEKVAELHQIVIDPKTDQVTALIAKKGFLIPKDKVIPISLVMESNDDFIKLYDFEGSYDDLEDYTEIHYVQAEADRKADMMGEDKVAKAPLIPYPPAHRMGLGYAPNIYYPDTRKTKVVKNIPEDQVDIRKGANVIGLNGEHVGNVEEAVVNPETDVVTHFVLSKGIFFTEEKLIPSAWVKGYDSNQLKLVVDSNIVEQLPEYEK